jgi:hypothetical protein
MAFRFKVDESIEKSFHRIGLEQIQRAQKQLGANVPPETGIHEARKCIKRIRALLRLGRNGLGDQTFRAENARFRDIATRLAPARDDHVILQTALMLEADAGDEARAALARLRAVIADHAGKAVTDRGTGIAEANSALERAARRFRRLAVKPDDFATIAKGLTRTYRRGLKWSAEAYARGDDEAFHEWRKCVQAHWRHMSLLSRAWPAMFEARVALARDLSQILGQDHDLAILKARLATLPAGSLSKSDVDEIARMIAARQQALRRTARPRGRMLYAEKAKAHGSRIVALWHAAVALHRDESEAGDGVVNALLKNAVPTAAGA